MKPPVPGSLPERGRFGIRAPTNRVVDDDAVKPNPGGRRADAPRHESSALQRLPIVHRLLIARDVQHPFGEVSRASAKSRRNPFVVGGEQVAAFGMPGQEPDRKPDGQILGLPVTRRHVDRQPINLPPFDGIERLGDQADMFGHRPCARKGVGQPLNVFIRHRLLTATGRVQGRRRLRSDLLTPGLVVVYPDLRLNQRGIGRFAAIPDQLKLIVDSRFNQHI